VTATAAETDVRRAAGRTSDADRDDAIARIRDAFTALPAERFPLITAHSSELVAGAADDRFRFAVDTFLDGLVARTGQG
jgi:hypothetical protein